MNILKKLTSLSVVLVLITACGQSAEKQSKTQAVDKNTAAQQVDNTNHQTAETCTLTMGWEPWEPYHYENLEKKVVGLDIEMMEIMENETGCQISYQKGDWGVLLEELKGGRIDFLTGASINNKRKEYATFSDGYRAESFRLFVRAAEVKKFSGFTMMALVDNGFRLGITMGYLYNDVITDLQDDPARADKVMPVSSGLINFAKLLEGDIDGFLEDPVVGLNSIRRQDLVDQIEMLPYEINTGDVHLMFSKASVDEKVIVLFNQALAKIRADGRHQQLMEKYTH